MTYRFPEAQRPLFEKMAGFTVSIGGKRANKRIWGTGVVISKSGFILTAYHVIEGGKLCWIRRCRLPKNSCRPKILTKTYPAEVITVDEDLDLALIKLFQPPPDLEVAKLGDSSLLQHGTPVFHLGLGKPPYVDAGHICLFEQVVGKKRLRPIFRASLGAKFGASGGPFVNRHGKLVGLELAGDDEDGPLPPKEGALEINTVKEILLRQNHLNFAVKSA